ncbi:MAG: carbohydrate ABC transporter permease [Vallitaleaceae bacterium]|nr:carbohydrate ABC transporter permease [Vallitaleaceae bacterium]
MQNDIGNKIFTIIKYTLVIMGAIIVATPIVYIIIAGFKTSYEISQPLAFPAHPNFENFLKVINNKTVMYSFVNSIMITCGAVFIDVIICSIAGYSIGRSNKKLLAFIYLFFLSAMMIPAVANLTSIYSIVFSLGLKNTRIGLILVEASLQIPMGILLFTGFIKTIPKELDEAAAIDGCGYFRSFYQIIFPLLKPITFSYAAISSISVWNDFLMPMLIISDNNKKPITLAIYGYVNEHGSDYGAIYAGLIIAMIPPILLFLFSQKYLYSGITAGAVKG